MIKFKTKNFKNYIEGQKIQLQDIAKVLNITPNTLNKKINNKVNFYLIDFVIICKFLEIDYNFFFENFIELLDHDFKSWYTIINDKKTNFKGD